MNYKILNMDVEAGLKTLPNKSIDTVITSPPYWGLRDYGIEGQIGLEPHPQEYITKLVSIFGLMKTKLKKTGSFYLNIGDTYCGSAGGSSRDETAIGGGIKKLLEQKKQGRIPQPKFRDIWLQPKQLMLMPSRLAIALQEDGWILRNDIIWHKPSHMPSSVKDRLTNSYEHLYHFVKQRKYYYDLDAIRETYKTEAAPFNYRVRDVKKKKGSCPQFKATEEEIQKYRAKTLKESEFRHHGSGPGNRSGFKIKTKYSVPKEQIGPAGGEGSFARWKATQTRITHQSGKNPSDFWSINPQPFKEAHFAVFPEALCNRPIKASCPSAVCKKCGKIRERIVKRKIITDEKIPMVKVIKRKHNIPPIHSEQIANYIKERRIEKGLSTIQVAELGKFYGNINHGGSVSNWESGANIPIVKEWKKLKEILQFDNRFDKLLLETEEVEVPLPEARRYVKEFGAEFKVQSHAFTKYSWSSQSETIGFTNCNCGAGFDAGVVLDPFMGSGTVLVVAQKLRRHAIGIEIKPEYCKLAKKRLANIDGQSYLSGDIDKVEIIGMKETM